jgi:hypothetical protein
MNGTTTEDTLVIRLRPPIITSAAQIVMIAPVMTIDTEYSIPNKVSV